MTIGDLLWNPKYPQKSILQKLICHICKLEREMMWAQVDRIVSAEEEKIILDWYKAYEDHKQPLEYILGEVKFFDRVFIVNPATLIPRPETEYMIEAVREHNSPPNPLSASEKGLLLDIGTGCGVLGLSVALQNPKSFSQCILTDYFANALEVAKKNYAIYQKQIPFPVTFVESNLLDFREQKKFSWPIDKPVILVANLPYIPEKTFEENVADNVKYREPKPAFVWGDDGLLYYYQLLDQVMRMHHEKIIDLSQRIFFFEMMTRQEDILREKYGKFFSFEEVKTFHFNIGIIKTSFQNISL
jgi:release factor glutamine methyltransferase